MSPEIGPYQVALLAIGIPVILWLTVRAVQRIRAIKGRIAQVQADLERNPQHPLQAMAELFSAPPTPPTPPQEHANGQRHD